MCYELWHQCVCMLICINLNMKIACSKVSFNTPHSSGRIRWKSELQLLLLLIIIILMLVNWISLYFFHLLQNTNKLCLLLCYFYFDSLGRRDFFFLSYPICSFPYSRLDLCSLLFSYLIRLFLYIISFLLFPWMGECLGKHSCMRSPFPIGNSHTE